MTKREFDAATKRNMGTGLASDERSGYRRDRELPNYGSPATNPSGCTGTDKLARRAAERRANPGVKLRCLATAPKRIGTKAMFPSADGALVIKDFVGTGFFVGLGASVEEREAVLATVR